MVQLAQVKDYIGLNGSTDDGMLETLIPVAWRIAEGQCIRQLQPVEETRRLTCRRLWSVTACARAIC
ncbi:MAG: hypothetical protein HC837_20510 [Chloroflexaceae bacterium]|nr:hypothetical protein [Chloroflexaceae bacterium]